MGSHMVRTDIGDHQMQRRESPEDPQPGDTKDMCGKKRHGNDQQHITEGGEKEGRQQHDKKTDPQGQGLFRFLACQRAQGLKIAGDGAKEAQELAEQATGFLPRTLGGRNRSIDSQGGSAAEDEAEEEAHAKRDAHGLKRVFADVVLGLGLAIVSARAGIGASRLGASTELAGLGFGLLTDIAVGGAGGVAEILRGGSQMLASGIVGDFGVFFYRFADGTTGFSRGIEGFFCVIRAAFQLLGGNVGVVCFAHGFVLHSNPATQNTLGKPQAPRESRPEMSTTAFAPGRVEILGNHTDYNGGVVLSAALQLGITATGEALPGGRVELSSGEAGTVEKIDRSAGLQRSGKWIDYPLGVAEMLARAGAEPGGFAARFESTLPSGAGLSSSAALEVATASLLMKLYPFSLGRMEVAKLCRRAENEFVGVNCGLLDQASSVFGLKDHLVFLDCRAESVKNIPLPSHFGLLVINSGVKHALVGGEYNERREQCFEAARRMGVEALRDVHMAQLEAADLPDLAKRRARHVVGENERVFQAIDALNSGDGDRLGALMTASHRSSMDNFQNSTAELDLLVDLTTKQKGCLGARLTGGGFGGAIVALVEMQAADHVLFEVKKAYQSQTRHEATGYLCRAGDGALPPEGSGA